MRKTKVLTILNRLDIGGTAMNTFPLMNGLQDSFDITILYGDRDSDASAISYYQINYPNVKIVPIRSLNNSINLLDDIKSFIIIKKWIKKNNPKIVHTHGSKSGFIGRIAAYFSNIKIIIHTYHGHFFHSYFGMFKTSLIVLLERFLARFTTKLITLSKSQFNDICHKYKISNEDKSTIIPLGIQVENFKDEKNEKRLSFRNKYKLNSNQLAIGIVGRIAPIKNHYLFIDSALLVLKDKVENIIFFIVGDGEETNSIKKYLNQQIKRVFGTEELINHFVFTSWHTEIEEVQNGLDIVVLTSSNEGTPLSLIEAQVCGKPVVVTNVGGVVDIVLDNETGFIVEKNCAIKLADKLLLLINNEDLRNKLGQKAKEFASESFSLQNQIEQTKDLYHKILEVEYK